MSDLPIPIDLAPLHRAIAEPYRNCAVGEVNDHEVRLSVMTGAFDWHRHPNSDEVFLVLEGRLGIGFAHGEVILGPGQMLTVPRGLVHRTWAEGGRSVNLTFERAGAETDFVNGPFE